jgi:hypothetical protein
MKLALAVLVIGILLWSEAGFGPCPITGAALPAAAQAQKVPEKAATPGDFVADKGRFRILLDGQPVGTEEFEIAPAGKDWVARGTTTLRAPDSEPAEVHATLRLAADGAPLAYEWSAKAQKKASAAIEFHDGVAKVSLNLEGATSPFVQELKFDSPRIVVLDNNVYHHYAILVRLYNWTTRGQQNFPVLIPQDMTPGNIAVEDAGPQQVEGAMLELLRVKTADLEVQLYLDSSRRLVRITAPASKVVVTRE